MGGGSRINFDTVSSLPSMPRSSIRSPSLRFPHKAPRSSWSSHYLHRTDKWPKRRLPSNKAILFRTSGSTRQKSACVYTLFMLRSIEVLQGKILKYPNSMCRTILCFFRTSWTCVIGLNLTRRVNVLDLSCFDYEENLVLTFFFSEAGGRGRTYSKYVATCIMFTTITVRQHFGRN